MEKNKDLENLLAEMMSTDAMEMETPALSKMQEAKQAVFSRKRIVQERNNFFDSLIGFFKLQFKFYHVGLSLLLITAGFFFINESNYHNSDPAGLKQYSDAMSIANTTISVNSSTMLTSIPTLVIRN